MKPTIIAIVGDSGSGKTHASHLLHNELNVFQIVSRTTRPKRVGEVHGRDYYFINSCHQYPFYEMLNHTKFGGYDYFALREQVSPQKLCIYIVDERGAQELKWRCGEEFQIVTVWIESSAETRIARGISEERIQRDMNRKRMPKSFYDFTIHNDGTIEEFDLAIYETFKKIEQWQHQK